MAFWKKGKEQDAAAVKSPEQGFGWKGYLLYYLGYTLLFCVMAAAVFVWLFLKKRRFVWQTDGVNQHYYGLLYFSKWGKEVLQNFRETGSLQFPTFSLRMGYGSDLYTTLAYYVIGDPFNLPALFVPEKHLLLFHDLMLLVRFWLAGITFSAYNFYMGRKGRIGVLAGALIYIFNAFTMSGMRHHYFLNPFVFFPLLLIGCEWYFRKKKPWLFLVMVFVSAVSNFYFFYMMVIMTVLYAVWRSVRIHGLRHFGGVIVDGIAFLWYGLIGTLLSSFIFLPIILRFLQDPRTADTKKIPLFWPVWFYRNFIDCFLTNGTSALSDSWTYMGFGAVALLCLLFIFVQRRKHFDLKAAFVGLTILLMTPLAGYMLNGFSYPANRWMWAYALLIGTMTATAVPELAQAGWKKLLAGLAAFGAVICICVFWEYTFSRSSAQSVIIGLLAMTAALVGQTVLLDREKRELLAGTSPEEVQDGPEMAGFRKKVSLYVQSAVVLCAMLCIASAAYYDFAPGRSAKVFEYLSKAQIETATAKDAKAASELIDGQLLQAEADENGKVPFYRYTTYNPENNTSPLYDVSNTQYYWSLSDASIAQFYNETGQLNRMIHMYDTLDDRTFLNEIAGIRYFLGSDAEGIPYGYEKKEGLSYNNNDLWPDNADLERYSCEVYENKYALPIGFTSDKWISRQDYDAMDIPERQQALMQGILLEKDPGEEFTRMSYDSAQTDAAAQAAAPAAPAADTAQAAPAADTAQAAPAAQAAGAAPAAGTTQAAQPAQTAAAGNSLVFTDTTVPVQIEYGGQVIPVESGKKITFEAPVGGEVVTIRFAGLPDCETNLYVRGLEYTSPEGAAANTKLRLPVTGYIGETIAADKFLGHATPDDPWTTGREDYYVNMRYQTQPLDHIDLVLFSKGTYSFDSIEVVCQPMTGYAEQAEALRASSMTDLDIHEMGSSGATDKITGHVELASAQILCIQIPCTEGWAAYVDGVRTEILQADTMFSALTVPAGSHDIELRYQTPGLRFGIAISLATLVLLILFSLLYNIISAILHGRDKRLEAIPVGTYTPAGSAAAAQASEAPKASETPKVSEAPESYENTAGEEAPGETEKTAEAEAPDETEKTAETEAPDETGKAAEAVNPDETEKTAETPDQKEEAEKESERADAGAAE